MGDPGVNKYQAMHDFFSSFGLKAYERFSVPTGDKAPAFPYLTYDAPATCGDEKIQINFSIWYRSDSMKDISLKAQEISEKIGFYHQVGCDEGGITIYRASNFIQDMNDEEDKLVKRKLFTVYARFQTIY